VFAVALTSNQLHHTFSMSAQSAAVLNLGDHHPDWYTGPTAMSDHANDLARAYESVQRACIYNVADPATERMVMDAEVVEGARAIGFTLGTPAISMFGLVEEILVDRAFIEERATSAAELCTVGDLADQEPPAVANALAAAALARSHGVAPEAVRDGLTAFGR